MWMKPYVMDMYSIFQFLKAFRLIIGFFFFFQFFLAMNTDYISKESDGETQNTAHKDMSSIYQEQKVQPCQLSSSIHYGGQDIYSRPKSTQDSGFNSLVITVTIVFCLYYIVIFRAYN